MRGRKGGPESVPKGADGGWDLCRFAIWCAGWGCPEAVGRDAGEVDVLYIGSRVWLGDGKELSARESGEGY